MSARNGYTANGALPESDMGDTCGSHEEWQHAHFSWEFSPAAGPRVLEVHSAGKPFWPKCLGDVH